MHRLEEILRQIKEPATEMAEKAQVHLDNLTKPRGALGRLEQVAARLCIIKGSLELKQPTCGAAIFAADHGSALDGVSLYPREVTAQMVYNFLSGGAAMNVLCRQVDSVVKVVDVGVDHDFEDAPDLIHAKVARGTKSFLREPAMTREEALDAMMAGAKVARELIDSGCDLLIPGEMGIGNTTSSSALAAFFLQKDPAEVTGRGTGLDDEGLARKVDYIKGALELHKDLNPCDSVGVLAALGGLEIAAIAGYALKAASLGVPVILDGIISTAGGFVACRICPEALPYFFSGHASVEKGQAAMLKGMALEPLLDLDMRLGEGTGAALSVAVVRAAVAIFNEMATFESAGVIGHED